MMPEMDGYETMKEVRKLARFKELPIIALTAKAMKGDRGKCLEAGASDYITKPVNTEQLLSLMRVWLYRQGRGRRLTAKDAKEIAKDAKERKIIILSGLCVNFANFAVEKSQPVA